jgi:hypothetical protein
VHQNWREGEEAEKGKKLGFHCEYCKVCGMKMHADILPTSTPF